MAEPSPKRPAKRRPDLETVFTINDDGSRNFLHPADVKGRWQVRKNIVLTALLAIYLVCFTAGVNGGVSGTGMAGGATPAMALRGGADTATAVSVHIPGAGFEQPRSHHAMVRSADPADA